MLSPVLLDSEYVQLLPGKKTELVTSRLQNPFNTAMLLDEIRIGQLPAGGEALPAHIPLLAAVTNPFTLQASFRIGRSQLTSEFIPVPCLGKVINPLAGGNAATNPDAMRNSYRSWRLPKPLFVPAGELVVPILFLSPNEGLTVNAASATWARVTYVGRSLPSDFPTPKTVAIPWVTMFKGQTRSTGGADFAEESTGADLVNPFDVPLKVQRFIGRIGVELGAHLSEAAADVYPVYSPISSQYTLVRMADSQGRHAVRDPTPFGHVFSQTDRTWEARAELPSKGFFLVALEELYSQIIAGFTIKPYITMVGHREVEVGYAYG